VIAVAKEDYFPKRVKTVIIGEGEPEIIEVEVPEYDARSFQDDQEFRFVGKPHPRLEAYDKVSGRALFVGDIRLPGMLYGQLIRSAKAKAAIKNVDTSAAKAMPGVKGVFLLGKEQVYYAGDIIGAVAAVTEDCAREAARAVVIEYEEQPHVVDIERSMRPGAPQATQRENVAPPRPIERGNLEEGFAQADKIVEAEYRTQVEIHQPIEPHTTICKWDDDNVTFWEACQTIYLNRSSMVRALRQVYPELNLTANKVRVLTEHVGGAFGCKIGPNNHVIVLAQLARMVKAPVKMHLTRYEQSVDGGHRPDSIQKYRIGAKNDGTLTAIELQGYSSGGIAGGDGLTIAATDQYKCPNLRAVSQSVYINTGARKAFRAPGHVQAFSAFEQLIDELAEELDMDPIELRKKNFTDRNQGGTGLPYSSNGLMQCYEMGAEAFGWLNRNKKPGTDTGPKKRGMGMAALQWFGVGGPNSLVEIDIFKDGGVNVRNGTQDIGTGNRTLYAQVAAEELGLNIDDINIQIGDTDYPPGSPSYGSINTSSVCPAVRNACHDVLKKLYVIAAGNLNVAPEQLEAKNGRIQVKGNPSQGLAFKEATDLMSEYKIMGTGRRRPNPEEYAGNIFGAQFCEVEVDTETGNVRVLRAVSAHDAGRIINPLTAKNQVCGGVNMAIGYALSEERFIDDRTGRFLNTNLHDYKVVPATEAPEITVLFADVVDNLQNNVGCKGLAEPPMISFAGAVSNAVYNAIGVRIRELPITPDKVLTALGKGGRS